MYWEKYVKGFDIDGESERVKMFFFCEIISLLLLLIGNAKFPTNSLGEPKAMKEFVKGNSTEDEPF